MSGTIASPYQRLVAQALGYDPFAATGGGGYQPASIIDQLLATELAQGAAPAAPGAPTAPGASAEQAPQPAQQQGGSSALGTGLQAVGYLNRANQLYNIGSRAANAYNTGGAMQALNTAAGVAIPAAAAAIFAKGAQTLAKPGGEAGAAIGSGLGGAGGLALMGALAPVLGPAAVLAPVIGTLVGGTAGGQIGPNPTVGPNFGALGTFDEQGRLQLTNQGGDNGGNAEQALALGGGLAEALPVAAAERGLVFNPRAAGEQITVGGYGQRGMFYSPTGYTPSPEVHAAFARDPEAYLNIVLGDLAARGVYVPQGTTDFDAALANRHANIPMNVYQGARPGSRSLGDLVNAATDTSFEGVLSRQRAAIDEWRRLQPILEQQRREAEEYRQQYPAGMSGGGEGYASGGVVELEGGGKIAIGPGGGLDDLIPTSINGRRAAALSDGEFVIPADVVSMLGDGSSNAGSRRLYDIVRQIRQAKTGTTEQAGPLPVGDILKRAMS